MQCGPDEHVAHDVADRVHAALTRPYLLHGGRFTIGASIGVAFWRPGVTAAELMREADLAMYDAKAGGKGRVVIHQPVVVVRPPGRQQPLQDAAFPQDSGFDAAFPEIPALRKQSADETAL